MYCPKCGAKNVDDATLCCECHSLLREDQDQPTAPISSKNNKKIGIIVVAAIVVVAAILLAVLFGKSCSCAGSYNSVMTGLCRAMTKADAKTMVGLIQPDILDEMLERYDADKSELIDELNDELEDNLDDYKDNYGKNVKITCKKVSVKDLSNRELRKLKEQYEDEFDIEIKDAKEVRYKFTIKGKDDEDSSRYTFTLIKVGNKWYIDATTAYFLGNYFELYY